MGVVIQPAVWADPAARAAIEAKRARSVAAWRVEAARGFPLGQPLPPRPHPSPRLPIGGPDAA